MSNGSVCRTALATQGLVKGIHIFGQDQKNKAGCTKNSDMYFRESVKTANRFGTALVPMHQ